MSRIDKKFKDLKKNKKKAFIAFITCGYPSLNVTKGLVLEFAKSGVDIVELGVPFSDPLADGPVIQAASSYALERNKINLLDILSLVKNLRKITDIPLCLMTYYNPIFCFGEEKFVKAAKSAGVDGIIVPDLPPEEAKGLIRLSRKYGVDTIFFLSPTSTKTRIKKIAAYARGFIYYVSLTGTTGVRLSLSSDLVSNIKAIKKSTGKPVCVGFGISKPEHLRAVNKVADGAIVGSAIVKKISENIGKKDIVKRVGAYVKYLSNVQ